MAQAAGAEKPLDVGDARGGRRSALLVSRDDERPLLPVLGEELLGRDGLDAARERS